jgi:hypothetical protein
MSKNVEPNKITEDMVGMVATVKYDDGENECGIIKKIKRTRDNYGEKNVAVITTSDGREIDLDYGDSHIRGIKSIKVDESDGNAASSCNISGGKKSRKRKRKSFRKRKSCRKRKSFRKRR